MTGIHSGHGAVADPDLERIAKPVSAPEFYQASSSEMLESEESTADRGDPVLPLSSQYGVAKGSRIGRP